MKRVLSLDGSNPIQEAFLCNTNALLHMDGRKQIQEHEFPILTASPILPASVFAPNVQFQGHLCASHECTADTQLAGSDL